MTYSKDFLTVLAAADPSYTPDLIVDFKSLPPGTPTTDFTTFVYENVALITNPYRIENFELFLLKHPEANAFAYRKDGLSIIGIHTALYKGMEDRLVRTMPFLSKKSLAFLNPIAQHIPIDFLIFQFMTMFTYYHELAHLNQFRHEEEATKGLFERFNLLDHNDFDQLAHAMEIDADMLAANLIPNHVIQYWRKLPALGRNTKALEILISLALSSVMLFFHELGSGWHDMYFLKYDHPHELIRTAYISEIMINATMLNFEDRQITLDYKACFQSALSISEELTNEGAAFKKDFGKMFLSNAKSIREYLEDMMSPFCKSVDFLIMNAKKGTKV